MTWTVQVTEIEKARLSEPEENKWVVTFNLLDGTYPHSVGEKLMVFAKDEIGVFYAFNKAVKEWSWAEWVKDIEITWFEKEEVQ